MNFINSEPEQSLQGMVFYIPKYVDEWNAFDLPPNACDYKWYVFLV